MLQEIMQFSWKNIFLLVLHGVGLLGAAPAEEGNALYLCALSLCWTLYLYQTVTQNRLRTSDGKSLFGEKSRFVTAHDLIKCLKQIKKQRLLLTCASVVRDKRICDNMGIINSLGCWCLLSAWALLISRIRHFYLNLVVPEGSDPDQTKLSLYLILILFSNDRFINYSSCCSKEQDPLLGRLRKKYAR